LRALAPRARIGLLEVGGEAVAFDYSFTLGSTLVWNGTGYDPAWSRFSPGWLLMLALLERAAGEGIARVEMLGGGESDKPTLVQHAGDRAGQRLDVARRHEQRRFAVTHRVRDAADCRRDDRPRERHCLEQRERQRFRVGAEREDVGGRDQVDGVVARPGNRHD